jgi:uncharacterized Fe-S cluster protein YjdI
MARKTYTGTHLDVTFDLDVCIHAGECVRRLPAVFDTGRKPWILPDAGDAAAIRAAVAGCPSGALEVAEHAAAPAPAATAPTPPAPIDIEASATGPLRVRGPVRVLGADGTVLRETDKVSLCGCGRSGNRPFCDGTHKQPLAP